MGAVSIRAGVVDDAETLFAIHRESAMTAYVHIFPPDRYAFPDAEMRAHWTAQLGGGEATTVIAERHRASIGFVAAADPWIAEDVHAVVFFGGYYDALDYFVSLATRASTSPSQQTVASPRRSSAARRGRSMRTATSSSAAVAPPARWWRPRWLGAPVPRS